MKRIHTAPRYRGSWRHQRLLLLYWPLYLVMFFFVERFYPVEHYHVMHCALDDMIPFNEFFLIPYLFWFVFLAGMVVYTLWREPAAFTRMMRFIILTYTTAIVIYLLFPTCQELRPVVFERDNVFTRFLFYFYQFDTNTNVCPSVHVIGSFAVVFAAWDTERFSTPMWKAVYLLIALLICVSTLFLKQHSILDMLAAIPICVIGYILVYRTKHQKRGFLYG